jgi:hypothetical protein
MKGRLKGEGKRWYSKKAAALEGSRPGQEGAGKKC